MVRKRRAAHRNRQQNLLDGRGDEIVWLLEVDYERISGSNRKSSRREPG